MVGSSGGPTCRRELRGGPGRVLDLSWQARGIEWYVVDPASIPIERQKRRARTDRLQALAADCNRPPSIPRCSGRNYTH